MTILLLMVYHFKILGKRRDECLNLPIVIQLKEARNQAISYISSVQTAGEMWQSLIQIALQITNGPGYLKDNVRISKWYFLMESRITNKLYAMLWSISFDTDWCFKQMPLSPAYQENCYEHWVSNLLEFRTAMVQCKTITPSPLSLSWKKKQAEAAAGYGLIGWQLGQNWGYSAAS